ISSTESPSGASTSTRSPPGLMKVILGITAALQHQIRALTLVKHSKIRLLGAVSCHTGLDLVKALALERRFHGAIHPFLGKGMADLLQGFHRGADPIPVLAGDGLFELGDGAVDRHP